MSIKITAVIVTLNEEKNLDRCLQSIQGLVDEILIVDSYSTDGTKNIAESYGATCIQKEWQGYAKTKNFANQSARNDIILSLDADEALSSELKTSIQKLDTEATQKAYAMNRLNNYCGSWIRYAGWYPDTKVRLFDRRLSSWEGDHVHEVLRSDQQVSQLQGDIEHYTYYTKEEHIERERKYAKLAAKNDNNPSWLKAVLSMSFRFFRMYILKLGLLHGRLGLQLCLISARSKWWRYQYAKA